MSLAILVAGEPARAAAAGAAVPAVASAAVASPVASPAGTRAFGYSAYEAETIAAALATLGLEREEAPEGKRVEEVEAVRLEVIEPRDPAPGFLNALHVVTRAGVVERELLLRPGDPWRQELADETRRNLAALAQLSLVLVVPARGSAPDRVRLVVVTKDLWSLRLDGNLTASGDGLQYLTVNPSERNLLGTHQTAGLLFEWYPLSWSLGARWIVPRVAGSHADATADAGLVVDSTTGAREGSFGDLRVTSPLRSSSTAWAWSAGAGWSDAVTRRYAGTRLAAFTLDPAARCQAAPSPCVPWQYRRTAASGSAWVTRSYGDAVKLDVSAGVEVSRSRFAAPDLSGYDPAVAQAFRDLRVPAGDDRVGPFLTVRTYADEFLRVLDLETLALQEDFRLGHDAFLRLYPVLRALGSSRDLLGLSAGASHTLALGDGFARATVEAIAELDAGARAISDGSVQATLRLASPRLEAGRLVLDAFLLDRWANGLRHTSFLGGSGRLRGYPSAYLAGANVLAANLEWRARPVQLLDTVQFTATLFYDAGDAFDRWDALRLSHAAGLGFRLLFPQLDRVVFRVDLGVPFGGADPTLAPVTVFVSFGQAFAPHVIAPQTALTR